MNLPDNIVKAALKLAETQKDYVAHAYGALNDAPAGKKVIQVYRRLDALQSASQDVVACQKGCTYCCYYHIYVTPLEVFTIAEHVAQWQETQRNDLIEKLRAYCHKTAGIGLAEHIALNIRCVFLRDQACSIYAIRPIACRRHHSGDVAVCERVFDNTRSTEAAPQSAYLLTVAAAMETCSASYLTYKGFDTDSYEFHAALLEALTNKACYKRWKDGKRAFPAVVDRVMIAE